MVNPDSRLALTGNCTEECQGDLSYRWSIILEDGDEANFMYCPPGALFATAKALDVTQATERIKGWKKGTKSHHHH